MSLAVIIPVVSPPYAPKSAARPFVKIDNREVFLRTVEVYTPRDEVTQRIVVVQPDDLGLMSEKFSAHLGFQNVQIVGGGADWFSCVARGLEKLNADITHVLIHDACCPAVPFTLLDAIVESATKWKDYSAIIPVLPARSAYADVEGGSLAGRNVTEFIDMASVCEVQSPQLFLRKSLQAAYAARDQANPTIDDAELVLQSGGKILTIAGSRFNQRVDSDDALRIVGDLINRMPKPKPKTPLTPFDEAQW